MFRTTAKGEPAAKALDLFAVAARHGNTEGMFEDVKPMIKSGVLEALEFFERSVITQDGRGAADLAQFLEKEDPARRAGFTQPRSKPVPED